jgi:hypothetical protein
MAHEYEENTPRAILRKKIIAELAQNGLHCSLNHLDLTGVRNMDALFEGLDFNGDISKWDVSKVLTMNWMFKNTPFNGDISKWNTRNVQHMSAMFESCSFIGDISNWNVKNARAKARMFMDSPFNGDLSKWDMSRTKNTCLMFSNSAFNQPIGMWDMREARHAAGMFSESDFNQDLGAWVFPSGSHENMFLNSKYQGPMPAIEIKRTDPSVLNTSYRGDFQNKYSLDEARILFGTLKSVDAYLQSRVEEGHSFDRLHIEKIVTSKRKPTWVSKEMSDWFLMEKRMHDTLNLCARDSLNLLICNYNERFLEHEQKALDCIPFDFVLV